MNLRKKLEYHYEAFNRSAISPDPLEFLHLFSDRENIEIMGLIASVFAYGNVAQINSSLNKFITISSGDPSQYLKNFNPSEKVKLKHRFYTSEDTGVLFLLLKNILLQYGSVENLFMQFHDASDKNVKYSLSRLSNYMISEMKMIAGEGNITPGMKFMFPDPLSGSACKRLNLFLRWMVRNDELDFGLWKKVRTDQLIIPVDTHIARIAQRLKLTMRKNISWNMAEEITDNLKKYDSIDPVKYDFALCHIGMRKLKL